MNGEQAKAKLLPHAPELSAAGILHLSLHGSVVRGDATPQSDIDLIAEFDRTRKLSLVRKIRLENRLTDILGVKADLADKIMLRPEVREKAEHESILVF